MYMNLDDGLQYIPFWKSWNEQCDLLNDEDRLAYFDALRNYAFKGIVPSENDVSLLVLLLLKGALPHLDASIKDRVNGKKGGAPKGNQNARKNNPPCFNETTPLNNPPCYEKTTNKNKNKNKNMNMNMNEEKEKNMNEESVCADAHCASADPTPKKTTSHFTPPSLADVKEFLMTEKGLSEGDALLKAERFVSFYESKGWLVGKNRMKSWRAAMSGWLARDKEESHAKLKESAGLSDTVLYLSKVM